MSEQKYDEGLSLLAAKKFNEALLAFAHVLEVDTPKDLQYLCRLERGICFHALKKWEECIESLANIDAYGEVKAKYFNARGDARKNIADWTGAESDYYVALWKSPTNEKYLRSYVGAAKKNKNDKYTLELQRICDINPSKSLLISSTIAKDELKNHKEAGILRMLNSCSNYVNDPFAIRAMADALHVADEKVLSLRLMEKAFSLLKEKPAPVSWNYDYSDISYEVSGQFDYPEISRLYNHDYVEKDPDSNVLNLVFSSVVNKFVMRKYDFNGDVLFLAEREMNFYTYNFIGLAKFISEIASRKRYKTVNLIGTSKGSFAAISYGIYLSKLMESVKFVVLAFSPQTQLFPLNENIKGLPSYVSLLNRCKSRKVLDYSLKKHGCLSDRSGEIGDNISINLVYGGLHKRDEAESLRVSRMKNTNCYPVEGYPLHGTVALFLYKGEKLLTSLKQGLATGGGDDAFFMTKSDDYDLSDFVNGEYYKGLDLNDFLEKVSF